MSLNTINQYALAIELISLGARTKIVAKETGLSPKIIRQAIEDMHGQSAPSGSLKTSPQFISKSFSRLKEGTSIEAGRYKAGWTRLSAGGRRGGR